MATARSVLTVTSDGISVSGGVQRSAPPNLARAALEWIDDPVGLLDERPAAVVDLWRAVTVALLGARCDSVVVVYPDDWPSARVQRVVAAVESVVRRVAACRQSDWVADEPPVSIMRRSRAGWVVAALILTIGLVVVAKASAPRGGAITTVVEGRMAVQVPAGWTAERITSGPGSRRVQVTPPGGTAIALHLTSAYVPEVSLEQGAEVLGRAIAEQPAGVFVDFRPTAQAVGRPAITYREVRPGRVIDWVVVQSGPLRISVGCQSPNGDDAAIRQACARAIGSAQDIHDGTER